MSNYTNLKSIIARVIRENGNQEITGSVLQAVLIDMVTSLGNGFICKGVVTPNSTITSSDQNIFYIGGAGFYPNFGTPFTVDSGYIGLFKYNGSWTLETVPVGGGGTNVTVIDHTLVFSSRATVVNHTLIL